MAVGVLLVSVAYAGARAGAGHMTPLYWLGQLTIVAAAGWLALDQRLNARAASALALGFGVATALTKWMYSPLQLKFPDELQHLLGTTRLLGHHGFGYTNPSLPISTSYPGLEIVAGTVSRMTGLSLDATGLTLGCLFHVGTVCLVSALLRRMTGNTRTGAIATVAYGCNASFGFFDSMFVYENLGVVFALLALLCVLELGWTTRPAVRWVRAMIAVLAVAATVVTHHITSFGLCLALVVAAVVIVRRRGHGPAGGGAWRVPTVLAAGTLVVTGIWIGTVASAVFSYLKPYTIDFTGAAAPKVVPHRGSGARLAIPANTPGPEIVVAAAGLLVLFLVCVIGLWLHWRRERRIDLACLVGAGALGALEVGRIVSARGSEVAGRSALFLYIPVAAAVGVTISLLAPRLRGRQRSIVLTGLGIAWVSAILIAWPAWWERLPGGSLVATEFERGNDPAQTAAAAWARTAIPVEQPIAADNAGLEILGTRSGLTGVSNIAQVFYAPRVTTGVGDLLAAHGARWLWVNRTMSSALSLDDSYYGSYVTYTTAPTAAQLAKFDATRGIDRVYDNGEVAIYNLNGLESR